VATPGRPPTPDASQSPIKPVHRRPARANPRAAARSPLTHFPVSRQPMGRQPQMTARSSAQTLGLSRQPRPMDSVKGPAPGIRCKLSVIAASERRRQWPLGRHKVESRSCSPRAGITPEAGQGAQRFARAAFWGSAGMMGARHNVSRGRNELDRLEPGERRMGQLGLNGRLWIESGTRAS